jgi:hypothetical protein
MDLYPILLYVVMICYRIFIISIRHATTSPRVYRELFTIPMNTESRNEALMYIAWADIEEERITIELTRALLKKDVF